MITRRRLVLLGATVLIAADLRKDDISGASDGEAWSIREILSESLKEVT
jgi:hypothetical protein